MTYVETPEPSHPLELRAIRVTVPDGDDRRVILDDVDATVEPGEIVAITGASGSGKSTLLAAAGLLRRVERGEVRIGGVDAARLSERKRAALRGERIGIIYQSANLLPSLTAREQLLLAAHVNGVSRSKARRRADELLEAVDLTARANQLPAHMSGGERQRVGIARALMSEPTVLLADEPTASLDPALADQIAGLLATQARERGLATAVVTHDEAPLRHADRRLHLVDGRLVEMAIEAV